jgi:hypothetical protein
MEEKQVKVYMMIVYVNMSNKQNVFHYPIIQPAFQIHIKNKGKKFNWYLENLILIERLKNSKNIGS